MNAEGLAELVAAMTAELGLLCDLAALEARKTDVLIASNTADLEVLVNGEQVLVWQLGRAEEQRQSVQGRLARELGMPAEELTLGRLVELAPEEFRLKLESLQEQYRATCDELSRCNNHNRELIKGALSYFEFVNRILQGKSAPGTVYTASGPARKESGGRTARFLDNRT